MVKQLNDVIIAICTTHVASKYYNSSVTSSGSSTNIISGSSSGSNSSSDSTSVIHSSGGSVCILPWEPWCSRKCDGEAVDLKMAAWNTRDMDVWYFVCAQPQT